MRISKDFFGIDTPIIATGIVEDRFDPLYLGRCRVRYDGWHTEDKDEMPTDQLPWTMPMVPLDHGLNTVGPKEGDRVIAVFVDGAAAQMPVMIGTALGIPEVLADPTKGFFDPREDDVLSGHKVPREPDKKQQYDDGSGNDIYEQGKKSAYPDEKYLKEPKTNRYERGHGGDGKISETVVQEKLENIDIGQRDVPTAGHPAGTGTDVSSPSGDFTEEATPYSTKYPYNHVYVSESGHMDEIDDTPNAERRHWYHRSGTFEEIHPSGLIVKKIVDHFYQIVLKSMFTHIEAFCLWTVDKGMKLFVNKDCEAGNNLDMTVGAGADFNITVDDGKLNIHVVALDANCKIGRDGNVEIDRNLNILVHDTANVLIEGDANVEIKGNLNYKVGGNSVGVIDGNKVEYIRGNQTQYVLGIASQIVGGDITRLTASNIGDFAQGQAQRYATIVDDFAPVSINHTTPVTNCSAELTGFTTDSDGDITAPGPAGTPISIVATAVNVLTSALSTTISVNSEATDTINETFASVMATASADADAAASSSTGFSGGAGGSGSHEPGVPLEGAPGGFLWKPTSDSTGKLVVLLPSAVSPVTVTTEAGQSENGVYAGIANGNRAHYRFGKPGGAYGMNITLTMGSSTLIIPDGSVRYEG